MTELSARARLPGWGRVWWGVVAALVAVALVIQVPLTAGAAEDAYFSTPAYRVGNLFLYFTIWSNILVAVVAVRLAVSGRLGGFGWAVARLAATVAILVTFLVYNAVLRGLTDLGLVGRIADELFHAVVPLLTVAGFVVAGPRGSTDWPVVRRTLVMPAVWVVMALVRGPVTGGFYPYPFLDVGERGLPAVLVTVVVIALAFVGLAALGHVVDAALLRRRARRTAGGPARVVS